jgi:hypothetical protein
MESCGLMSPESFAYLHERAGPTNYMHILKMILLHYISGKDQRYLINKQKKKYIAVQFNIEQV